MVEAMSTEPHDPATPGAPAAPPTPTPTPTPTPAPTPATAGATSEPPSPPSVGGVEVRARVLAEVKDAVAAARAAQTRAAADPAEAVHEVRKALRRMRAIVDAVAPALSRDAHRGLRKALIEARRTLGPARDRTVAHLTIADVPAELVEHARALIAASAAQAPAPTTELEAITRAVAEADAQAVALAAALPDDLRARQVARGLAVTYARARRARRKARRSERAIHRWRRRTKELIYQLVLIGDDERGAELRHQLLDVDVALGRVVDHLLVKDFVGLHGGILDGAAAGALLAHVHDALLDGRDQARTSSKALFATRPRTLRKHLRRALRGPAAPTAPTTPTTSEE